ncbi:MAG: hypothetical protein KatS3mg102_1213 [Planctomycetota bacterium]|nr:MAG: hypothetical protein KatS3mg102_1213 [Planctomycetota bacterium]
MRARILALLPALIAVCAGGCRVDRCEGSQGKTGIDLRAGRYGHLQLALPNGRVAIIGGVRRTECGDDVEFPERLELFDPTSGAFAPGLSAGPLGFAFGAGAVSDAGTPGDPSDDYLLIAGGITNLRDEFRPFRAARRTAVRIALDGPGGDPGTVEVVEPLGGERLDLRAVALPDGRVAFAGGRDEDNDARAEVFIYAPDGRTLSATITASSAGPDPLLKRYNHQLLFVPNLRAGWLLLTGGRNDGDVLAQANAIDLQDLSVYVLGPTAALIARQYHTSTYVDNGTPGVLGDDAIVEVGGLGEIEENIFGFRQYHLDRADVFTLADNGVGSAPNVVSLKSNVDLGDVVFFHAAAAAGDGRTVVVAGGFGSLFFDGRGVFTADFIDSDPVADLWRLVYDPADPDVLAVSRSQLQQERAMDAACTLADGTVLVTGGINGWLNSVRGAEIITP